MRIALAGRGEPPVTSYNDPFARGMEWLERQARESDEAHEFLKALADLKNAEALLDEWFEKLGDLEEAEGRSALLGRIEEEASANDCLGEMPGNDLSEQIVELCRGYERYEAESFALRNLAVEAGLLKRHDFTTDPLPLIRMFLPIDE